MFSSALITNKNFINGEWVDASSATTNCFQVINPADGETVLEVANSSAADAQCAVDAAYQAFSSWRTTTARERNAFLKRWHGLINDNAEELANICTLENGKTLAESMGELKYANGFVEWCAEEALRTYGDFVPSPVSSRRMLNIRQPIGVAAMITPWNFPLAMITRKACAALAAGCTVVLKPAEDTPLSALALSKLAQDAGCPAGVLNVVTCSRDQAPEVGKVFCESPLVSTVSFTGSSRTGKILLKQCAETVKRVSLELGGNAPFIVFDSANLDLAVQGALSSRFRCTGQTCISANRILVQEGVYDSFLAKLRTAICQLKVGSGLQADTTQGPLVNAAAVQKVERLVNDAKSKGAKVVEGGNRHKTAGDNFFEPTLLSGVNHSMSIYEEEIFGPVASCIRFKTEDEVLKIANSSRLGLAGYFYSSDMSQCWRVAERLEVGMVGINEAMISSIEGCFGGVKESGLGREGGKYALDEYLEYKYLCFGDISS